MFPQVKCEAASGDGFCFLLNFATVLRVTDQIVPLCADLFLPPRNLPGLLGLHVNGKAPHKLLVFIKIFFQLHVATLNGSSNVHVNCEHFLHAYWVYPTQVISRFPCYCCFSPPLINSINSIQHAVTEDLMQVCT